MESMTDWAFSWPISTTDVLLVFRSAGWFDRWFCAIARRTLVVVHDISQVVSTGVMRLAHTHRVVCQIDIAVVA
jgi:hypothetical protein